MIIRTLRPCEVAGRTVAPGITLDLLESQANALIDAGDAEQLGAIPPAPDPEAPAEAPAQEVE